MSETTHLSKAASDVNWLLSQFRDQTSGISQVVAVSSDGLLMAAAGCPGRDEADRFAAVTSGLLSLGRGSAQNFNDTGVNQVIVDMHEGMLFVSSISDGSALGVRSAKDVDMALVGYEMTMLVKRVGQHLSPAVIVELKQALR